MFRRVLALPKASSSGLDCRMMSLTCCESRVNELLVMSLAGQKNIRPPTHTQGNINHKLCHLCKIEVNFLPSYIYLLKPEKNSAFPAGSFRMDFSIHHVWIWLWYQWTNVWWLSAAQAVGKGPKCDCVWASTLTTGLEKTNWFYERGRSRHPSDNERTRSLLMWSWQQTVRRWFLMLACWRQLWSDPDL